MLPRRHAFDNGLFYSHAIYYFPSLPTGLEIAEALQKLANAFGIAAGNGEAAKEAMAQLTAAYQADNPEFLLEGAGQVAVEEVVSEEVVTDEPMVVIETEDASTTTVAAVGTSEGAPSISDSITITMTDTQSITSTITTSVTESGEYGSLKHTSTLNL